jgi:2-polyprenyl-6-methoxyphenol hydroxylase-like FAD-dependent oxidoreductase
MINLRFRACAAKVAIRYEEHEAMSKRIVVVGAGAVGGYTGGRMAQGGEDVTLIDAWPEHVEHIRKHGLQLSGVTPQEKQSIEVPALHISDVQRLTKERPVDIASSASNRTTRNGRRTSSSRISRQTVSSCRCRTASTKSASPQSWAGAGCSAALRA